MGAGRVASRLCAGGYQRVPAKYFQSFAGTRYLWTIYAYLPKVHTLDLPQKKPLTINPQNPSGLPFKLCISNIQTLSSVHHARFTVIGFKLENHLDISKATAVAQSPRLVGRHDCRYLQFCNDNFT